MSRNKWNLILISGVFLFYFSVTYSSKHNFFVNFFAFSFVFCIPITITIWAYTSYYLRINQYHLFKLFRYSKPLSIERTVILERKFLYYQKLSSEDKIIFKNQVNHFLINKKIVSDNNIIITDEMEVLIAATAIQILFGRDAYYLSKFSKIRIIDSDEVKVKNIKLSNELIIPWKAFSHGYESMIDGYNPGIKILAMAMNLEYRLGKVEIFNSSSHAAFTKLYKIQAEKYIASGKSSYKSYNEVNRNEYFGVAVEYFFERPEHFYANQSEMYMALSKLLRQDPLGNFIYKR
jgi:Mlc titration factor MtfA (ptsG expression regulator)